MQPQRPVGRDDRGTGRIGVHPDAAAFDAGAPAQRHLHQHEILQFVGFDLDFGAVAQGTDRQRAEAAAVQARVDPSAFPGQPVFLEGFRDERTCLVLLRGAEHAPLEQGRQL